MLYPGYLQIVMLFHLLFSVFALSVKIIYKTNQNLLVQLTKKYENTSLRRELAQSLNGIFAIKALQKRHFISVYLEKSNLLNVHC